MAPVTKAGTSAGGRSRVALQRRGSIITPLPLGSASHETAAPVVICVVACGAGPIRQWGAHGGAGGWAAAGRGRAGGAAAGRQRRPAAGRAAGRPVLAGAAAGAAAATALRVRTLCTVYHSPDGHPLHTHAHMQHQQQACCLCSYAESRVVLRCMRPESCQSMSNDRLRTGVVWLRTYRWPKRIVNILLLTLLQGAEGGACGKAQGEGSRAGGAVQGRLAAGGGEPGSRHEGVRRPGRCAPEIHCSQATQQYADPQTSLAIADKRTRLRGQAAVTASIDAADLLATSFQA